MTGFQRGKQNAGDYKHNRVPVQTIQKNISTFLIEQKKITEPIKFIFVGYVWNEMRPFFQIHSALFAKLIVMKNNIGGYSTPEKEVKKNIVHFMHYLYSFPFLIYLLQGRLFDLGKPAGELLGGGSHFAQYDDGMIGAVDGEFLYFL